MATPFAKSLLDQLPDLSRDRSFLIRASIVLVSTAAVLAWVVSFFVSTAAPSFAIPETDPAEKWIEPASVEELIALVRYDAPILSEADGLDCFDIVTESERVWTDHEIVTISAGLPQPIGSELIAPWWSGLRNGEISSAIEAVEIVPTETSRRNEFLGDLYYRQGNWSEAVTHYFAEVNLFDDSTYARRSAILLLVQEGEFDRLDTILTDPGYREAFSGFELRRLYADTGRFGDLGREILLMEWNRLKSPYCLVAFFTAAIWFGIFMIFWRPTMARVTAAIVAFAAGILSAALTVFFLLLQERVNGFTLDPNGTLLSQFLYFLVGVGLREETAKLICFLPLAIWAARRRSDLEGIVLAGIVGLGFAFQENIGYFLQDDDPGSYTAWGRLLTANALHFSMTGIAGFYLYRMIRRKFHGWEEFLAAFIAVVLVHGIYNAVISIVALQSWAVLSTILVALVAYQYLDPMRAQMDTHGIRKRVSPMGILVLGSVLLTAFILVASAFVLPFRFALGAFASSLSALIPLAFAFISRFRDL